MWPIRTALSGKQMTPGGATEIMEILGKEESLNRIKAAIEKYAAEAFGLGCVPLVSLISMQLIYGKMLSEIAAVYGVSLSSDDKTEIAALWAASVVFVPVLIIPGLSAFIAENFTKDEGEKFIKAIEYVIRQANGNENNKEILERIKIELQERKG